MKLINKNTYRIEADINENKLSAYNPNILAILDDSELIQEIEGEIATIIPPQKYIDSLIVTGSNGNFDIVKIIEKSIEDKETIDANLLVIETERLDMESYKGFKYKVTSSLIIMDELNPYHSIYKLALLENNPREVIYDIDNNPTHVISYWNEIKPNLLVILNDETILIPDTTDRVFKLEMNPYIEFDN